MTQHYSPELSSLEALIHEEEVRYNEAFRMNAEFQVLKTIRQKIKRLKAELSGQKPEVSSIEHYSATN